MQSLNQMKYTYYISDPQIIEYKAQFQSDIRFNSVNDVFEEAERLAPLDWKEGEVLLEKVLEKQVEVKENKTEDILETLTV